MTLGNERLDGRTYMISAAVLAMVAWGAIKALLFFGRPAEALGVMAALIGVAIAASLTLARRLDETGRAVVRFSWYWGGGGAMALTVAAWAIYAAAGAPFIDEILRGPWSPIELIALGAFGLATAQVAGFAIAGAAWWLRR
ncbi:MAG: hypothetical protein ACJ798_11495 [Phenylobacterium sp.]